MAVQVQFFSLFIALGALNGALSSPISALESGDETVTANIDKIFDAALPLTRKFMIRFGMEPLRLPDFNDRVLPLPGMLQGSIELTEGWMQQMTELRRSNHIIASYSNKLLHLEMDLGWDILDFNYNYLFKYLLVKRTGELYGTFKDPDFHVSMTVDLNNYYIYFNSLGFTTVRKLDLKLDGHAADPLLNVALKLITTVFKQHVLNAMESRSATIFTDLVTDLNSKIRRPDRVTDIPPALPNRFA